jgi:phosphoribosylpyrophosphate synthetase
VIVPFFAVGTMERIDEYGQVPTALTLAKMMSATPLAAHGPTQFVIFDIHALATQHFFGDSIQVRLKSCIPLLHDALVKLPDVDKVVIGFPDEGARKRFKGKLDAFGEPIVCIKKREGDVRKITIQEGEPAGRHVVLVDDLVQSGSTLMEAAKALRAAGAARVSAYVTHAVFPKEAWRRFLPPEDGTRPVIETFYITNSVPTVASQLVGVAPFEILSIAGTIEDILGV